MSDATTEKSKSDEIADAYAGKAAEATRKVVSKTLALADQVKSAVTSRRAKAKDAFGAARGTVTGWWTKAKAKVSTNGANGTAATAPADSPSA